MSSTLSTVRFPYGAAIAAVMLACAPKDDTHDSTNSPPTLPVYEFDGGFSGSEDDLDAGLDLPPSDPSLEPGMVLRDGPTDPACLAGSAGEPLGLTVEDVDGDEHLDLLQARCERLLVRRGRGDGYFDAPWQATFPGNPALTAYTADLDQDGAPDLIWPGIEEVVLLRNRGDGTFAPFPNNLGLDAFGTLPSSWEGDHGRVTYHIQVIDMSGNGYPDILVGGAAFGSIFRTGIETFFFLPTELWLGGPQGFSRDTSWPDDRGGTLHSLITHIDDDEVGIAVLNDFSEPQFAIPELNQTADNALVRGRPGNWSHRTFRDAGVFADSPMGGVALGMTTQPVPELVISSQAGLVGILQVGDDLFDATSLWGLDQGHDSLATTWTVLPLDLSSSGERWILSNTGDLPLGFPSIGADEGDLIWKMTPGTITSYERDNARLPQRSRQVSRGGVLADINADGRPDVLFQGATTDHTAGRPVQIDIYEAKRAGGEALELRFDPLCRPIGARVQVWSGDDVFYDDRFLPYTNMASMGNAPTDRLSVGVGGASEIHVRVEGLGGQVRELRTPPGRRVFLPCVR